MNQQTDVPAAPNDPHSPPAWLAEVLVVLVIIALAFAPAPVPEFVPTSPMMFALVLSPVVIVPLRRRWPFVVLALLLLLFGSAAAAGTLSPGLGFAVAVAVFHLATRVGRTVAFLIGGCSAVILMLLSLLASVGSPWEPQVLQFGLVVALAAAAGDGARSRRAYVAAIKERAERAVQSREAEALRRVSEERLRIARDLHDAVAHQISVISLNAGAASTTIDTRPDKTKEALVTIRGAARTVLREIGDLMAVLRADGDEATAKAQGGLERLVYLVEQFAESGLDVKTRIEGDLDRVIGSVDLVAYRVVQEALTNAHKHGAERRAHVLIRVQATTVTVTVTNPINVTSQTAAAAPSSGLGLVGLRERVVAVRGAVEAGPVPAGWKLEAALPLAREADR